MVMTTAATATMVGNWIVKLGAALIAVGTRSSS